MMPNMILLPYPSLTRSAECYSDDMLQMTLKALLRNWQYIQLSIERRSMVPLSSYEIWRCWHNWKQGYVRYFLICAAEAEKRGQKFKYIGYRSMVNRKTTGKCKYPLWLGWEKLHAANRANLLFAGECETTATRICHQAGEKLSVHSPCVSAWLRHEGFNSCIYAADRYVLEDINNILDDRCAPPPEPNYYNQFNWTEEMECNITVTPLTELEQYLIC